MQTVETNTRITLNNVLLATDFSQASKLALPYAIALARQYGAKVFVARAISVVRKNPSEPKMLTNAPCVSS